MDTKRIVSFLRELRDCKYCAASCVLKRSYRLALSGSVKEASKLREEALRELRQVFILEKWIGQLGGILPALKNGKQVNEVEERHKVIRLVKQNLPPPTDSRLIGELRAFLVKLAQEEKIRIKTLNAASKGSS